MDSGSTPNRPIRDISAWTFEQVQEWSNRPGHHGQEMERIREVTVSHAQSDRLDVEDRKRWAKLSLQVNARMHGDGPWEQARRAANDLTLRTFIIDRLGPDAQEPDWNPDVVAETALGFLTLTPERVRELSEHWQGLPVDQIGELRRIKNMTRPLQRLFPLLRTGPVRDQVLEWLAVRDLLP